MQAASSDSDGEYTSAQHIMISYEWGYQQNVLLLADCLQALGYKVWLDVNDMSGALLLCTTAVLPPVRRASRRAAGHTQPAWHAGSTLEAMADAVERAGAIICCVSPKYKNSQACRTEAEYAFQKQKRVIPVIMERGFKPSGWLGALVGTLLYFNVRISSL